MTGSFRGLVARKSQFINTYDPPSYEDSTDLVRDYERVQKKAAAHPNKGSGALSSMVDLPRERIRTWVDSDGMPDCYRGLQTALSNGWIIDGWDEAPARGLNCLAAWILSSGGIKDNFVPTFIADAGGEYGTLQAYANLANVSLQRTRESSDTRPSEWVPRSDASVLGRILYTWIDFKGDKSRGKVEFPAYLREAPDFITWDFLQIYVQQRGVSRDDPDGYIQISVDRSESFRLALKSRLQSIVADPEEIRGEGWPLRIYGDAKARLSEYPQIEG
jgi:hypothetical protein